MEIKEIKISDIPEYVLPYLHSTDDNTILYLGHEVKEIFEFKGLIRINTTSGQYRVKDGYLEFC